MRTEVLQIFPSMLGTIEKAVAIAVLRACKIISKIIIISGPEKTYGSQEARTVFMHKYGRKADNSRMTKILYNTFEYKRILS